MKRTATILLPLILVAGLSAWLWWRYGSSGRDDYDYAAAFEAPALDSNTPVVKIAELVGRSAEELRATLGEPQDCETTLYSSRCSYGPGGVEIVFIDGKADWITVSALGETTFAPAALARIGIAEAKPNSSSATELVWTQLAGLREVRVVGDGEHVEFIRIKAKS